MARRTGHAGVPVPTPVPPVLLPVRDNPGAVDLAAIVLLVVAGVVAYHVVPGFSLLAMGLWQQVAPKVAGKIWVNLRNPTGGIANNPPDPAAVFRAVGVDLSGVTNLNTRPLGEYDPANDNLWSTTWYATVAPGQEATVVAALRARPDVSHAAQLTTAGLL